MIPLADSLLEGSRDCAGKGHDLMASVTAVEAVELWQKEAETALELGPRK
jgi:hypothetical protein